jgi:hypothetical protein
MNALKRMRILLFPVLSSPANPATGFPVYRTRSSPSTPTPLGGALGEHPVALCTGRPDGALFEYRALQAGRQ